jgi:hypothetical protein
MKKQKLRLNEEISQMKRIMKKLINEDLEFDTNKESENEDDKEITITVDPELLKQCDEDNEWYLDNIETDEQIGPMNRMDIIKAYEELDFDTKHKVMITYRGKINPFIN